MKRKRIKFDQFIVWVFQMDEGEIKHFLRSEITRNLTTFGDQTLNSITVFVRGSFVTYFDGAPPRISVPGMGGERYVVADSLRDLRMAALDDGSEYHCIMPRDHDARFWQRAVRKYDRNETISLSGGQYFYVADGLVQAGQKEIKAYELALIKKPIDLKVIEPSIVATLWIDEPQSNV